ncbi:MAG: hypothetical protein HY822_21870, partial [Acidobacteria bacterium]|nr:hypothetical protein [Acidobacteriota bacterium]
MMTTRLIAIGSLVAAAALAGPKEFGIDELNRAIAGRRLKPELFRFRTEITSDAPETYRILPGRISGGDLRGLMYGLLDAAEQIRAHGRVLPSKGAAATPIRGIRYFLHNEDLERDWYYSKDYWVEYLRMLARHRFNRFNLVFAHQTNYLAPPYPFWLALTEFPEVRVPGLGAEQRARNLDMLRFISQTAADHGIDFTLGVWEHNVQTNQKPTAVGITEQNIGPYSYAALKAVLAACPAIRSVQMRTNSESGIPNDRQTEFYSKWVWPAIREAGRRVTLDLRGWVMRPGLMEAALNSGVPLRLSSKYWGEFLGRPYPPAETWPNYSYINFLERPNGKTRPWDFYFELWGLGSHRLLLWGDPEYVRRAVSTFGMSGASGFEIDPPLAQKGFGNRPGKWGVFTEARKDRAFWKWEFERYWMFYQLWGRLSYDPKTPETVWTAELQRRFGAASPDVYEAYRASSRVLNEIVAAHLADPNMYIWPEVNPGGLIDAYREVRPSDFRLIATISEAVRNRIDGLASAKQTPAQTAARLQEAALKTRQAVERARGKLAASAEWRSSEPDFLVLAHLAGFHSHKQVAAEQLEYFYRTGDATALETARREAAAALSVWESLTKATDGVYPDQMASGPDDAGHWKDRLPYVAHDLKTLEERARIFELFGRFDYGFDFGGPVPELRPMNYRNDPYVLRNTVEPRFQPVDAKTPFSEKTGYGWAGEGERQSMALERTPYLEVRTAVKDPKRLPANVLFGDSIRGRGAQTFRLRARDGEYSVKFLAPDGSATEKVLAVRDGVLDVVFPEGEWNVAGLVITSRAAHPAPAPQRWPRALPRPAFTHVAPKSAEPGKPLVLVLSVGLGKDATTVRLHYRAVNQLAKFKTLDAPATRASFVIPAE